MKGGEFGEAKEKRKRREARWEKVESKDRATSDDRSESRLTVGG